MFRFRGQRKDNGEWVEGAYIYKPVSTHNGKDIFAHCIVTPDRKSLQIHPSSLSISTGKPDSKEEEIFASFEVDGVMTTGGDVVEVYGTGILEPAKYAVRYSKSDSSFLAYRIDGNMIYELSYLYSKDITIVGKQGGGNECN